MASDLPFHVSEVPNVEPRGNCIYVNWRGMEFYLPVAIATATVGRYHRALDKWHEEHGCAVLPFRPTAIAAE